MTTKDVGRHWRDLWPALGLIAGAVAALLLLAVGSGDGTRMALAVVAGAGVGLVLGAITWLLRR